MLHSVERCRVTNAQQMEVAVNGPDGATHLILCTGIVELGAVTRGSYTFLVGPPLSRRQFVSAIASGALAASACSRNPDEAGIQTHLVSVLADFDPESGQVKVSLELCPDSPRMELAISYNVSILAELPDS